MLLAQLHRRYWLTFVSYESGHPDSARYGVLVKLLHPRSRELLFFSHSTCWFGIWGKAGSIASHLAGKFAKPNT